MSQTLRERRILYRPSNGSEADGFYARWCENCANDKVMSEGKKYDDCGRDEICQIIAATMAYNLDDQEYPQEWTYDKDGRPCCTAFVAVGSKNYRCEKTPDMFERMP